MGNGRFDRYSVTIDTPIDNNTNFLANDINGDGLTDILKCSDDTLTAYINKKGYISESIGFDYGLPVKYSIPVAVDINTRNSFSQVVCLKTDEVYKPHLEHRRTHRDPSFRTCRQPRDRHQDILPRTDKLDAINEEQIYLPARDAAFPYVNLLEPIPVVGATEFYLSGESLGKDIYSYTNAVVHRQGLGLCGFQTVRKTDARNRSTVCEYEPYRHGLPKSVAAPGSEASFTYSVKTGADRTVQFNLDSKTEKDLLKGTTATSSYTYDPYGFPTSRRLQHTRRLQNRGLQHLLPHPYSGEGLYPRIEEEPFHHLFKTGISQHHRQPHRRRILQGASHFRKNIRSTGQRYRNGCSHMTTADRRSPETVTPYSSTVAHKTEYGYNPDGLLISETDELRLETAYSYNAKGQTVSKTDIREGSPHTPTTGQEGIFGHTPRRHRSLVSLQVGEREQVRVFSVTRTDTGRPQTEEIYDALGRWACKSETRFDGSRMYVYREFDPYGNVSA